MSLSSKDNIIFSAIGSAFLGNFVQTCPLLILFGAFFVLFPYSIFTICQKPSRTAASRWLLALTTILFLCDAIYVASGITFHVLEYQYYLIAPKEPLESRRQFMAKRVRPLNQIIFVTSDIIYIIADGIVLWRAWVLYGHTKAIRALIILVGAINSMVMITDAIINNINAVNLAFNPGTTDGIDFASVLLSFVANLCGTMLIANRLWQYRQNMRRNHFTNQKRTKVEKILILVVETGLGFCIIQLVNAIVTITDREVGSSIDLFAAFWHSLTTSVAAIYPTLIVIVVSRDNSSVVNSTIAFGGGHDQNPSNSKGVQGSSQPMSALHFATGSTSEPASFDVVEGGESADAGLGKSTGGTREAKSEV